MNDDLPNLGPKADYRIALLRCFPGMSRMIDRDFYAARFYWETRILKSKLYDYDLDNDSFREYILSVVEDTRAEINSILDNLTDDINKAPRPRED